MRILQISLYYYPDKTGIAVTSTDVAEWFAARGDKVTVLSGLPFYPEWRIDPAYRGVRREVIRGVEVLRTRLYVPRRVTTLRRMVHELSFVAAIFLRSFSLKRPDVIVLVSPPLTAGLVAIWLKLLWRRKLLLNVKDLVPDAAIELDMLRRSSVIHLLHALERFVYRFSDRIASLGHGVLRRIEGKGVPASKLLYLPDTADPGLLEAPLKPRGENAFLRAHGSEEDFIVLHSGNMGVKQGLEVIVETARVLRDERVRFYIVGTGAARGSIVALAERHRLDNLTFLPLQPRDWLADMYHAADVCLLTQRAEVVDIVVPSKLISMMAAGCCVVASAHSDSEGARLVRESGCGTVVEPDDPEGLARAILHYRTHRDQIPECRRRAREYIAAHYSRNKIMNDYRGALEELAFSG